MRKEMAIGQGCTLPRSRELRIRHAERRDAKDFAILERACYGSIGTKVYGESDFHAWLDTYADFFFIAEHEGRSVGYMYSLRTDFAFPEGISRCDTYSLSRCASLPDMHVHGGNTVLGISIASIVRGAGRSLYDATFRKVDILGLDYFIGHTRLSGLAAYVSGIERGLGHALSTEQRLLAARAYTTGCARLIGASIWSTMLSQDGDRLWPAPEAPDLSLTSMLKGRAARLGVAHVTADCLHDPQSLNFGAFVVRV